MGITTRDKIANYLNTAKSGGEATWSFMGLGFSQIGDSPSAKTSSKRYVHQKGETKNISGYDWSAPYTYDQIESEEAIKFINNIGENELTGDDANTDYVKVYLNRPVSDSTGEYEAYKRKVAVEVSEFSDNDGEMQGSGNLLGVTDWVKGKFNTSTKTFTEEE